MKQNLKEEIERNLELMELQLKEDWKERLSYLTKNAINKISDKVEDFLGISDSEEETTDSEKETEKKFGEVDDLQSDDVEEIAKFYEDETDEDIEKDNSESLKDFFESEGIKYGDVDSGGDMDKDASAKFKAVLKSLSNEAPEIDIRITSGNDQFHQRYPSSNHAKGRALDLVISPKNDETVDKVYKVFCNSREKLKGFSFIDEYRFPSAGATGGHFHLSYNPEKIEDLNSTKTICSNLNKTGDESPV